MKFTGIKEIKEINQYEKMMVERIEMKKQFIQLMNLSLCMKKELTFQKDLVTTLLISEAKNVIQIYFQHIQKSEFK